MKRFFGMMPSCEVKIENKYKTDVGTIILQAGKNGYSIIYADGSSQYKDIKDIPENNYKRAYDIVKDLIK